MTSNESPRGPPISSGLRRFRSTSSNTKMRSSPLGNEDYPLTEYSRYELHGYQDNVAAGQETFVANRAWHAELADLHEDFWIFNSIVVRMVYDEEGHFLYPEQRADLHNYLSLRDRALRHAIPLGDYLRKYEPDLLADPL